MARVNSLAGVDVTLLPEHLHLGPANGASAATISYDADGRVTQIVETIGGDPATTTLSYAAQGAVAQTQTLYHGCLRTVTFSTKDGRVTGFAASEEKP